MMKCAPFKSSYEDIFMITIFGWQSSLYCLSATPVLKNTHSNGAIGKLVNQAPRRQHGAACLIPLQYCPCTYRDTHSLVEGPCSKPARVSISVQSFPCHATLFHSLTKTHLQDESLIVSTDGIFSKWPAVRLVLVSLRNAADRTIAREEENSENLCYNILR